MLVCFVFVVLATEKADCEARTSVNESCITMGSFQ